MTRTIRRLFRVSLLVFIVVLNMSACSKQNDHNESASLEKGVTKAGSSVNQEEPYTLRFVFPGAPQQDEEMVEVAINEYLRDKMNAKIDLVPIEWGPWDDKVNLMIASREKFDIMFTAQWNKHAVNVSMGAFVEIDDLMQKYGQGILQTLDPVFLEGAKIGGKNYAVPTNKELAAQGGIIYRKDIAEELGIDTSAVKTIDDLDAVYRAVLEKKPNMLPIYMKLGENFNAHYIGNYDALGDTSIPGILLKDADSTQVLASYDVERYVNTLRTTRDFFLRGYINKDAATNQTMTIEALRSGDVFSITASLKPGKAEELAIQTGLVGKLGQLELNKKTIATSETAGSMLAISSTSQAPELAMMFINLLHTDIYLNNLLNFGIEGKHYVKVDDHVIQSTAQTENYNLGASWMFGNQFLNYVWSTEKPDKWEQFLSFNQNAAISPGLGFVFESDSVRSEVAAVVNVNRQYQAALETGSVDIDKVLPEYIAKLKAAGIESIIREKQAQFDLFLQNQ